MDDLEEGAELRLHSTAGLLLDLCWTTVVPGNHRVVSGRRGWFVSEKGGYSTYTLISETNGEEPEFPLSFPELARDIEEGEKARIHFGLMVNP